MDKRQKGTVMITEAMPATGRWHEYTRGCAGAVASILEIADRRRTRPMMTTDATQRSALWELPAKKGTEVPAALPSPHCTVGLIMSIAETKSSGSHVPC